MKNKSQKERENKVDYYVQDYVKLFLQEADELRAEKVWA